MSKPICQNYGHTNDFCVDNTFDAAGNVIEIALKCEMVLSEVIMEIFVFLIGLCIRICICAYMISKSVQT